MSKRIGVISDTHGLLRDEAIDVLRGVDGIIHAGDIGKKEIVEKLQEIAPLTIIKGNNDKDDWALEIPDIAITQVLGQAIYVLHNLNELALNPEGEFSVVVSGHSHVPKMETRNSVLYFNPGSAGPRRFKLPIAIGFLTISEQQVTGEIVELIK